MHEAAILYWQKHLKKVRVESTASKLTSELSAWVSSIIARGESNLTLALDKHSVENLTLEQLILMTIRSDFI